MFYSTAPSRPTKKEYRDHPIPEVITTIKTVQRQPEHDTRSVATMTTASAGGSFGTIGSVHELEDDNYEYENMIPMRRNIRPGRGHQPEADDDDGGRAHMRKSIARMRRARQPEPDSESMAFHPPTASEGHIAKYMKSVGAMALLQDDEDANPQQPKLMDRRKLFQMLERSSKANLVDDGDEDAVLFRNARMAMSAMYLSATEVGAPQPGQEDDDAEFCTGVQARRRKSALVNGRRSSMRQPEVEGVFVSLSPPTRALGPQMVEDEKRRSLFLIPDEDKTHEQSLTPPVRPTLEMIQKAVAKRRRRMRRRAKKMLARQNKPRHNPHSTNKVRMQAGVGFHTVLGAMRA